MCLKVQNGSINDSGEKELNYMKKNRLKVNTGSRQLVIDRISWSDLTVMFAQRNRGTRTKL
jgi:hypothetical protein